MSHEGLVAAAGALRDGIAAIDNLAQLLRSRRVGPRPLTDSLPDLREGAESLGACIDAFCAAATAVLADDREATQALARTCARASATVKELEHAIDAADPRTARGRLALEASVQVLREGVRELPVLADLLAAAVSPRPAPLVVGDVLSMRWRDAGAEGEATRAVHAASGHTLSADPRVVHPLVEIALASLASGDVGLEVDTAGPSAQITLVVRPPAAPSTVLRAPVRTWSADALAVACGAARVAGIRIQVGPERAALVFESPAARSEP